MGVQIVTVIPLSRSLPKDHLDYFSTKEIKEGDIVEIPIKKQTHKALVIGLKDAENRKAELRGAGFRLRALTKVCGPSPFSSHFLETLHKLERYYIGNKSQIFSESISQPLLHNLHKLKKRNEEKTRAEFTKERLLFQQPLPERLAFYKTLIRESFAKGESVRFVVPTLGDTKLFEEELSKGIRDYCFTLHSKKTSEYLHKTWNTIVTTEHPLCLIHTPQFLCVPRHDTGVIILEQEHSPHYQGNRRPYIDGRVLTELFARTENVKYIVGDTLLRTETLVRRDEQEFGTQNHLYFRIDGEAEHVVVDMRSEANKKTIIDSRVLHHIDEQYKLGKKIVLFALRPGLASTTICNDCGTTQTYKGTPLSLHVHPKTKERYFKSKKYNETFRTNIVCQECGGWNLESFGIGTEKVEEILLGHNSSFQITRIDQNHNHTPKQAGEAVQKFYSHEGGSILVTSPLGLPYLKEKVSLSVIVSLDSLFNIPQFNMYEKIMHIIMDLSTKTSTRLYVQTRYADQKIVSIIQSKKLLDFFEYDVLERKHWDYPPFSNIIKMSYEGPRKENDMLKRYLQKTFADFELYTYESPGRQEHLSVTNVVLKIPLALWPFPWKEPIDKEQTEHFRKKLEYFPSSWSIIVNPQNFS